VDWRDPEIFDKRLVDPQLVAHSNGMDVNDTRLRDPPLRRHLLSHLPDVGVRAIEIGVDKRCDEELLGAWNRIAEQRVVPTLETVVCDDSQPALCGYPAHLTTLTT
jgi:hypothetical protein